MIFTSRIDNEILVSWTTFDFLRRILIDCINMSKFTNNIRSKCECTETGFKGWEWAGGGTSVFLLKTFLIDKCKAMDLIKFISFMCKQLVVFSVLTIYALKVASVSIENGKKGTDDKNEKYTCTFF